MLDHRLYTYTRVDHTPTMQRTRVRRRVLACARCRKRKLSVLSLCPGDPLATVVD